MTRLAVSLLCAAALGAGYASVRGDAPNGSVGAPNDAAGTPGGESQTSLLRNGAFDQGGSGIAGWEQRGTEFGTASLVSSPVSSAPRALQMTASRRNSTGDNSLMLYQVLDAARYRGQRLRFGARVRTRGAGMNLTLYTPERAANVLHSDPATAEWVERAETLDVPSNASFLSLGIQVFGTSGTTVWVDDVFVTPVAAEGAQRQSGQRQGGQRPRALGTTSGAADPTAAVTIEAGRVSHQASPLLFGMHLEWVENGQGLLEASRAALRPDVMTSLDRLDVPLFRYPGGIHADYYDWRLGVGAASQRGRVLNPFTKQREVVRFGTPEFVELLRATGAEAMITANYGTGTAGQAAGWARQFKTLGVSPRYWEVGNEIYLSSPTEDQPNGRAIYKTAEQYARDFPRFRDSIRAAIPGASVGAIVHIESGAFPFAPADNRDWSERMLAALTTPADFVAIHPAYAPVILDDKWDLGDAEERGEVYRAMYASTLQVRENFDAVAAAFSRSPGNRATPVRIAVTEFGAFFGLSTKMPYHNAYVDHTRTLASALYIASLLDVFLGEPRVFAAAYTNPIHQYYGSLLTNPGGAPVRTPAFHVYEMYRTRFEPRIVQTAVQSPTFNTQTIGYIRARTGVPELVARAGLSADGRRLTAMLVNRSADRALATTVTLRDFAPTAVDCRVLSAASPAAINGASLTSTVVRGGDIAPRAFPCTAGASMSLAIPANAVVSVVATR